MSEKALGHRLATAPEKRSTSYPPVAGGLGVGGASSDTQLYTGLYAGLTTTGGWEGGGGKPTCYWTAAASRMAWHSTSLKTAAAGNRTAETLVS